MTTIRDIIIFALGLALLVSALTAAPAPQFTDARSAMPFMRPAGTFAR